MSLSPLSEKSSPFATGFRRGEICVLYGAGNLGMSMVEPLRAAGFLPIGFLDRQKGGRMCLFADINAGKRAEGVEKTAGIDHRIQSRLS